MKGPLLLRLLSRLLEDRDGSTLVGDLEENVRDRQVESGWWASRLWLIRQMASLPLWLALARIEGLDRFARSHDPHLEGRPLRPRIEHLRSGIRAFIRSPTFSGLTVLTLSLGIAASTAVYSVVDGILLEGLPYPEAEELVFVWHTAPGVNIDRAGTSTGLHVAYEELPSELESIATYRRTTASLSGGGAPEEVSAIAATSSIFQVLETSPALGRAYTPEEDLPGAPRVAVIGHGLWVSRFGSDPTAVGRTIRVGETPHEIIGVMPPGFSYPRDGVDIILPLRIDRTAADFGGFNTETVARVRPGSGALAAEGELNRLLPRMVTRFDDFDPGMLETTGLAVRVQPLKDVLVGPVQSALWVVFGTVVFVLLIACANVGNLFLARAEGRHKEVAIRTAMGAGKRDLAWQYAAESGVLALASGLTGTALAYAALRVLLAYAPGGLPRISNVSLDGSSLLFAAAISILAAVLFGTVPMLRHGMSAPGAALKEGSRGSSGGRKQARTRRTLVAAQVAFALVLLAGSGLMLRSFRELLRVDLGFRAAEAMTFRIGLPGSGYPDTESVAAFHQRLIGRMESIPGVLRAGATSALPLSELWSSDPLNREEAPLGPGEIPDVVELRGVSPGYFATMEIPLQSGRLLEKADVDTRAPVVLINQTLAQELWPEADPIGRRVMHGLPGTGEWSTVVGVVGDTPGRLLTEPTQGLVYYSLAPPARSNVAWISRSMTYVVRSTLPTDQLVTQLRDALAQLNPNLPMAQIQALDDHVEESRVQMSFTMLLLSLAAVVGLVLGAVGVYGVMSYLTSRRTREIGVRMALGAEAGSVRRMVLREGALVCGVGVVLGLIGAFALTRYLETLLYRVSATDPTTLTGVTALLVAVSLLASYLPARRAAAIPPQEALRVD